MLISAFRDDLCLDFANTLSWRGSAAPAEALHDLSELLGWIERSAYVGARPGRIDATRPAIGRTAASRLFAEAIAMREAIFRIFSAIVTGAPVRDRDFAALKRALAKAPRRDRLARSGGHYGWRIEPLSPSMPDILAPVLWSAGDLLLDAGHRRIRRCANEQCLWLFLDESKSGTRRWCDMAACGNRAKARRHYARSRRRAAL